MDRDLLLFVLVGGVAVAALGVVAVRWRRRSGVAHDRAARAEAALRVRERTEAEAVEVRGLILESMQDGVLLADPEGRLVFANHAIEQLLGSVPSSVDGLRPEELQRAVRRAGHVGDTMHAEVETGPPSRWVRATATPAGTEGSVLLVLRDITEARRLDAVRRDFVANASHELKTPVASIRAAAETLRDGAIDDPPAARRFTEQLEKEAVRLSRIVSDLLDLSRLETGSELGDRVRVDELTLDEVQRLEDRAAEAEVALSVQADGVPPVLGSARDLALLVRNLVDNAIRYTPGGGRVDVSVSAEAADVVVLRVRDTGVGIPRRDLPRVFERFYRVDRARSRDTGGTGLGLAIVRHVAENHGGSATVQSELGAGSTFEVRLPAAGRAP
jgi:PAS domain S-box-containing protein